MVAYILHPIQNVHQIDKNVTVSGQPEKNIKLITFRTI